MAITPAQLKDVSDRLQVLSFIQEQDTVDKTANEVRYLEHYGLVFSDIEGVQHYVGKYQSRGFQIACHYWLPKNPVATYFVVHGYFDHVGLYGHLIEHLLKLGYAVVAFDLPGHGLSSGERVTIESFDHYVDVFSDLLLHCERDFPKPWKATGQSTGGAILIKYIMAAKPYHYKNDFEAVVLFAPLIQPQGWKMILFAYKLLHRVIKKIKRRLLPNTADEKFNQFLANDDPLQTLYIPIEWVTSMKRWAEEFAALPHNDYPLKVIQGDCDNTVDWEYNLEVLRKKFQNIDVEVIHGAQHHMVNETVWLREKIFKKIN